MSLIENAKGGSWEVTTIAQHIGSWLVDGPKRLFADVDATADLLKLVSRIQKIFEPIIQMLPLKRISEACVAITDFVNARNFIGGLHDLISGKAAWENPFSLRCPDLLKVASKLSFLVGDLASLAHWLSSIHLLGEWVNSATAQIVTWGKEFNLIGGIGDFSCITGALLSISDTVRMIVKEFLTDGYFKEGRMKWSLLTDHLIDVAYDISGIASTVLSNIPGVPAVLGMISMAVGSSLSLSRFFKKEYWKEPLVTAETV